MTMPRTVEEIHAHAGELATRFENFEPEEGHELSVDAIRALRQAVAEQSSAERHLLEAVKVARESGMSWATIGTFVGTSGEAARQRYSKRVA